MTAVLAPDGAVQPWWRTTWPLHTHDWLRLAAWLVVVITAGTLLGLVLTDWTAPNALTELDQRLVADWAAARTDTQTDLATWGARISDTAVKIGVTALVVAAMAWRWRRFHEPVFVTTALVFEALAFISITFLVGRERPAVERLLDSPVDSSFPSGHAAAATVYGALAVVVFWHTRAMWARVLAVAVAVALPVIVGLARIYQGMHHPSDVLCGVALGVVSLAVCHRVLGQPPEREAGGEPATRPASSEFQRRPVPPAADEPRPVTGQPADRRPVPAERALRVTESGVTR